MRRARGFSLVELMVAVTLALLLSTAVLSVFIGSRNAFHATSGTAAVSDNGRFALGYLEGAIRDAGNMACGAPTRTVFNVASEPTPLFYTAGPAPASLFQPLAGFEAAGTGLGASYSISTSPGTLASWTPTLDGAFSSLATLPVLNNDVLVVRSSTQGAQPAYVTAVGSDFLTLTSVPASWLTPAHQLAVVSDCVKSMLFQISSVVGNSVFHDAGGSPGNLSSTFPASMTFAAGSEVTPLETTVYYIGVGADGDGALFAATVAPNNTLTTTQLVPDIEAMQILYGLDTTGTQTVSEYVTADLVTDFTTVMNVRIALLAAGPAGSATAPATANTYTLFQTATTSGVTVVAPIDTRFRQVFETTIATRNLLP